MLYSLVAAGGGGVVDVNVPTILWTWAAFLVTLWALSKVAWPMLAAKMEEREIRIREGLEKAEEAERRATELLEKQEEILQQSRDEASKLLADSRAAAEHLKNEALASAQEEISAERDRARKEIALEGAKALEELKSATIDLTLEAAGMLLQREMKDEDHRRLAADVIQEVESRA
ncbi:MAG: F0F1 ATP synthase subunit B [Planctomycetota bacterium]|jgi:F-type H+-transporting ATPase subunit b